MKKKLVIIVAFGIFLIIQPLGAQTWTAAKRLTWNPGYSYSPTIAMDSNNHLHVVWHDTTSGNTEIYYKRSTNGGATWTSSKRFTWNSGSSVVPVVTVDSNDHLHVVWQDYTPGNYELYHKRSTDGGTTWSKCQRLTWNIVASYDPVVTVDSNDHIHVLWEEECTPGNYEIYYKRSTNGGASWTATKRLTWNAGYSTDPAIAVDSSNHLHVVWTDDSKDYNYEIFYKRSTDGGTTWSKYRRITWTISSLLIPTIAVDSNNHLHVVWHDNISGNTEIYYKRSTNAGATWSSSKRFTWNIGASYDPVVTVDSNDHLHVVWHDDTPGNKKICYKRSTDGGSSWSKYVGLTWNRGHSLWKDLAVDSNNHIHVVWDDDTPGNWEIFYKKGIQ